MNRGIPGRAAGPLTWRRHQEVIMTTHRVRKAVLALVATAALPLGLLALAPASQAAPATYEGTVTATSLNVRKAPTTAAGKVGSLRNGARITIQCKVFGPSVAGNDLWYKLATGRWVTARHVSNVGSAPRFCGTGREYHGKVVSQGSLSVRSGPHTTNARVSSAPRGQLLPLVCKVDSQSVGGNTRWYQLVGDGGGQWVAARYVANVGTAPPYC
jgi:uncharacterized protein YraI